MKFTNFTYTLLAITISAQEIPVVPQQITAPSQGIPMVPQWGNVVPQENTAPSQTSPIDPQIIVDPFLETNDSSKENCSFPFGGVELRSFFSNMEFSCSNFNRGSRCTNLYYEIPNEYASPGGCKLRKEPPVMDAIIRKYDCRSAGNHWSFANEMVNRYNLTCDFIKKRDYY